MGGGEVLKKGWLIKSPPLEGSGIKNWRKRFFALRSSKILEYYKAEDGDLKGVINLEDCKAVNSDLFHKKYKYVFDVETHDRVYYLVANSAEDMEAWVEALCSCCGFTLRPDFTPTEQASKTMSSQKSSKSDAIISPPVSTLPANVSGMLLSEKFKTEESASDVYSLATAAVYEVNNQLGRGGVDIPSGTSLSDALNAKGMVGSPFNPAITPLPDSAYFAPRDKDVSALYAVPKKLPKQQSLDVLKSTDPSPKHRPLGGTMSDASVSLIDKPPPPPPSHRHAETISNGVTRGSKESSRPRPPNYDFVTGPPRPAETSTTTHRSALLRASTDSSRSDGDGHTYINMKQLHNEIGRIDTGPRVDRSKKPNHSPPIDRDLKPGSRKSRLEEDSPPDSPPNFPTRTGSVSSPPILDASDLPKPTRRTVKYSQLSFDSNNKLCMIGDEPVRAPIPVPRPRRTINYSDIDIKATNDLASKKNELPKQVSLGEAEAAALAEKPYVNICRDGYVDDDTDPDYYTHMRNLPADSLFHAAMNDDENELYDVPPREDSP